MCNRHWRRITKATYPSRVIRGQRFRANRARLREIRATRVNLLIKASQATRDSPLIKANQAARDSLLIKANQAARNSLLIKANQAARNSLLIKANQAARDSLLIKANQAARDSLLIKANQAARGNPGTAKIMTVPAAALNLPAVMKGAEVLLPEVPVIVPLCRAL